MSLIKQRELLQKKLETLDQEIERQNLVQQRIEVSIEDLSLEQLKEQNRQLREMTRLIQDSKRYQCQLYHRDRGYDLQRKKERLEYISTINAFLNSDNLCVDATCLRDELEEINKCVKRDEDTAMFASYDD